MGKSIPIQTFSDEIVGWYLLCIYTPTNMYQFTDLHLAISNKLGWGDMLAEIALPAIQQIINGFANITMEMYGTPETELHLEETMPKMDVDVLFTYLLTQSIEDGYSLKDLRMFISLRGEIEDYMRHGCNYQEAIAEWFK